MWTIVFPITSHACYNLWQTDLKRKKNNNNKTHTHTHTHWSVLITVGGEGHFFLFLNSQSARSGFDYITGSVFNLLLCLLSVACNVLRWWFLVPIPVLLLLLTFLSFFCLFLLLHRFENISLDNEVVFADEECSFDFNDTTTVQGCTFAEVYVPCIYTHARWFTVGDSGRCCCVPCLSSAFISLCWLCNNNSKCIRKFCKIGHESIIFGKALATRAVLPMYKMQNFSFMKTWICW